MKNGRVFFGVLSAAAVFFAGTLSASQVPLHNSVGSLGNAEGSPGNVPPPPFTIISIASAGFTGQFSSATVLWSGSACPGAFKIKFFRGDNQGHLNFLGERGPFDAQPGLVTVALNPPVSLQPGDAIGVGIVGACGLPALTSETSGFHAIAFLSDVTTQVDLCDAQFVRFSVAVQAVSGQPAEVLSGTVLGVGSAPGANGANFKTSVQLSNPGPHPISGHIVFHPIGKGASSNDPQLAYSLAAFQTTSFPDIVAAMNASGLGSLDIFTNSSYAPVVLTRVFTDAGTAGTFGYTEPTVHPDDPYVLAESGDSVWLVAPDDLTKFRYNIGVRSLFTPADLKIEVFDPSGNVLTTVNRSYSANDFELTTAQSFLNGFPIAANQSLRVTLTSGTAIVCGVPVENKSNDTSFQLGDRRRY